MKNTQPLGPKKKFVADSMLLGLARWLRFLGFQTWNFQDIQDLKELLRKDPNIIYLTCSKTNIQQLNPTNYYLITEDMIERQLHKIDDQFGIFQSINLLSLCTICNSAVEEVDKKEAGKKVPSNVSTNFDKFWKCPDCQRIYWDGGHIRRLKNKLVRMKIPLS